MKIGKTVFVVLLTVFCLSIMVLPAVPTGSTVGGYDPQLDINHDSIINMKDIGEVARSFSTSGDPTVPVNVTNWPSQLLSNYVYDSGFFTLGPYPHNDSWTYRDLSIAGYRQVSVYVGFDTGLDVLLEIRVGMGDFSGATHPGGYNWATYYNISTVTGQLIPPFTQTIDVRGPQLTIEVYNDRSYSIDGMRIVVYATC